MFWCQNLENITLHKHSFDKHIAFNIFIFKEVPKTHSLVETPLKVTLNRPILPVLHLQKWCLSLPIFSPQVLIFLGLWELKGVSVHPLKEPSAKGFIAPTPQVQFEDP